MRLLLLLLLLPIAIHAETISVPAGGDVQAAINAANPGDTIVLQAGASYTGNFVLKVKTGDTPITLQSSRCGELPPGVRVGLSSTPLMARLETPNVAPVLQAPVYTHHYKFQCLEFTQGAAVGEWGYNLIQLGEGASYENQKTMESVPHHFDFDRVIVRARDAATGLQRGITLNSASTTITNSYFSDIKWKGTETQCLGGWNGPGPYLIENNYLESAGINVLFGGATPSIPNLTPSDITIRRNVLTKRLEWKGQGLAVKNLFELKNARRVTVTDNFMEYSWPDAQVGWAVIMNAFHDGGWEVVDDVQFSRNLIRNTTNGINLRGSDTGDTSTRMHRIQITDNRIEGLGYGGAEQKAFQVLESSEDVVIEHNTVTNCIAALLMSNTAPLTHLRLKFNSNLIPHGSYGVFSDGGAIGVDAMNLRASQWEMAKNALIATPTDLQSKYPNTYFPATAAEATGLLGTDGQPVGVRSGAVPSPTPTPVPSPSPTPTPAPSPSPTPPTTPCSITAPQSVSMPQWSSAIVAVTGSNLSGTITASTTTGQVTVTPTSRSVSGTSFTAQYRVDSKKKSGQVTFGSPCGSKVMQVVVS